MAKNEEKPTEKAEKISTPNFKSEIEEIKVLYESGDKKNALELLQRSFETFNNNRELLDSPGREEDHIEAGYFSTFRDFGDIEKAYEVIASMRMTEHNKNQFSARGRIENLLNVVNELAQTNDNIHESDKLNNIIKQLHDLLKNLDENRPKPDKEKRLELKSTADFQHQIELAKEGDVKEVIKIFKGLEQYLQNVRKGSIDKNKRFNESGDWKDDGRWIDHREKELFDNYIEIKNWPGAKRTIESMQDTPHGQKWDVKENRIKHLEKMSGLKYNKIEI